MQNSTTAIAMILTATILAGAVVFLGLQHYELENRKVTIQAVEDCLHAATTENFIKTPERDARTVEPIKDIYAGCLNDKRIEVVE